jgi:hypothetical protein
MDLYIYYKNGNKLCFDKYEIQTFNNGLNNSSIYYYVDKGNHYKDIYRIACNDIGKVIKEDNTVALIGRDDKKASDIFADYYSKQIEKLQKQIDELQNKKNTNKVLWVKCTKNGYECLEEIEVNFNEEKDNNIDLD